MVPSTGIENLERGDQATKLLARISEMTACDLRVTAIEEGAEDFG